MRSRSTQREPILDILKWKSSQWTSCFHHLCSWSSCFQQPAAPSGRATVAGFISTTNNNNGEMANNLSLLKFHTSPTLSGSRRSLTSLNQSWRQFPPSQAINVRLSSTWSCGDTHKCLFIYCLHRWVVAANIRTTRTTWQKGKWWDRKDCDWPFRQGSHLFQRCSTVWQSVH